MSEEVQTEWERTLQAFDAALASIEPPELPSIRQVVVARKSEIRRMMAQGHKLPAIRDHLAKNGFDIKLETLRDYVYNAEPSGAGRVVKAARTRKKAESPRAAAAPAINATGTSLPDDWTEATAGGGPVRASVIE